MAAKAKPLPSYTRLCELYTYNAKTGIISRIKPLKGQAVGPLIPTKQYDIHTGRPKYWQLNIDGQKYYYHRVAWKLYTGEDPPDKLDHKNGNIWNNRIRNLRKTTTIKNAYNRGVQKNNKLGVGYGIQEKALGLQLASTASQIALNESQDNKNNAEDEKIAGADTKVAEKENTQFFITEKKVF